MGLVESTVVLGGGCDIKSSGLEYIMFGPVAGDGAGLFVPLGGGVTVGCRIAFTDVSNFGAFNVETGEMGCVLAQPMLGSGSSEADFSDAAVGVISVYNDDAGAARVTVLGMSSTDETGSMPTVSSSTVLQAGVTYDIVATFASEGFALYINGVQEGSAAFGGSTPPVIESIYSAYVIYINVFMGVIPNSFSLSGLGWWTKPLGGSPWNNTANIGIVYDLTSLTVSEESALLYNCHSTASPVLSGLIMGCSGSGGTDAVLSISAGGVAGLEGEYKMLSYDPASEAPIPGLRFYAKDFQGDQELHVVCDEVNPFIHGVGSFFVQTLDAKLQRSLKVGVPTYSIEVAKTEVSVSSLVETDLQALINPQLVMRGVDGVVISRTSIPLLAGVHFADGSDVNWDNSISASFVLTDVAEEPVLIGGINTYVELTRGSRDAVEVSFPCAYYEKGVGVLLGPVLTLKVVSRDVVAFTSTQTISPTYSISAAGGSIVSGVRFNGVLSDSVAGRVTVSNLFPTWDVDPVDSSWVTLSNPHDAYFTVYIASRDAVKGPSRTATFSWTWGGFSISGIVTQEENTLVGVKWSNGLSEYPFSDTLISAKGGTKNFTAKPSWVNLTYSSGYSGNYTQYSMTASYTLSAAVDGVTIVGTLLTVPSAEWEWSDVAVVVGQLSRRIEVNGEVFESSAQVLREANFYSITQVTATPYVVGWGTPTDLAVSGSLEVRWSELSTVSELPFWFYTSALFTIVASSGVSVSDLSLGELSSYGVVQLRLSLQSGSTLPTTITIGGGNLQMNETMEIADSLPDVLTTVSLDSQGWVSFDSIVGRLSWSTSWQLKSGSSLTTTAICIGSVNVAFYLLRSDGKLCHPSPSSISMRATLPIQP